MLLSIFGKVYTNMIGIGEPNRIGGAGLYIGLSAQNHSCDPDAYVLFDGNKAILRSPRVKEYSKDVTVTYTDLLCTSRIRQKDLQSRLYFTCTCSICSDPTRDFLRNSVRSACCPDSYCLLDPNASKLSCFKCGKPSKITVDEAIIANDQVSIVAKEIEQTRLANIQYIGATPTIRSVHAAVFQSLINTHGQFSKAIIANDQVSIVAKEIEQTRLANIQYIGATPTIRSVHAAVFQSLINTHGQFSKVLSPLNTNLLRVTDELFKLAFVLQNHSVCRKLAPNIVLAYKRYFSVGDPVLSNRLMLLVIEAVCSECNPTRKVLELLEEALATSVLTYDPRHPHFSTAELERLVIQYRMALQMNIS